MQTLVVSLCPNHSKAPCTTLLIDAHMVWLRAQNPQYRHLKTSVCTFTACVYVPDPVHTHVMWLLCSFDIKTIQNQLTVITARLLVNHLSQASDWSPSILPKWQFYSLFQDCLQLANGMGQVSAWTGCKHTSGWEMNMLPKGCWSCSWPGQWNHYWIIYTAMVCRTSYPSVVTTNYSMIRILWKLCCPVFVKMFIAEVCCSSFLSVWFPLPNFLNIWSQFEMLV